MLAASKEAPGKGIRGSRGLTTIRTQTGHLATSTRYQVA